MEKPKDNKEKEVISEKGKLTILGIEAEKNFEQQIDKITFICKEGKLTWKPKVVNETFQDGLKLLQKDKMNLTQLPVKLKELQKIINTKGKVVVNADYQVMKTTDNNNKPVQYKFIRSENELNNWEIIEK